MRYGFQFFAFVCLLMSGCQNNDRLDQLNALKKGFLNTILEAEIEEGPFHFNYTLRTVFFSKDLVSLFGEFGEYTNLPHGRSYYEGKTFCKINGRFKEITLNDLFVSPQQKEFLRNYCEKDLKNQGISYFSGVDPLCTRLEQKDIHTFVIDDQFLMIIFQPYIVGGWADSPFLVKIPYEHLKDQWDSINFLSPILNKVIASKSFIASWDQDEFYYRLEKGEIVIRSKHED